MSFKIKDGVRIGTVDVFNNSGALLVSAPSVANSLSTGAGLTGGPYNGSGAVTIAHSNSVTAGTASEGGSTRTLAFGGTFNIPSVTYDANGHITGKGSITLTLPASPGTPNNGTFAVSIGTAGATNTTVTWGTATGFSANAASNLTYDLKVGPALTNLATLMTTAGAGFIKRGATADTYTIDTNTYLTAESDTLQTVTGRGATSSVATITLSASTASSTTSTGTLVVTGGVGIGGAVNIGGATAVGGNLTVTGNLIVNGTTTTINSTTITVDDILLELGDVTTPTDTTANGGGILLKGTTNKTITWLSATNAWTSSVAFSAPNFISTVATGTAPLTVASTTLVTNLNADLLDGNHASAFALSSSVGNGTLGVSIGTAGASGTTVTWGTSTGFSANTASNVTYDLKVGPALTALATLMNTAGAGFIKRGATANTYTIDTNTYLTSESDTLDTVVSRGNSTGYLINFTNTTDSTDQTNGAVIVSGGVSVVKNLTVGGSIRRSPTAYSDPISDSDVITASVETVGTTLIDSWSIADYRSAKYLIQLFKGSGDVQVSEVLVLHNDTTTTMTQYGVLEFGTEIGTITSDISGGNVRLFLTVSDVTFFTQVRMVRTRITD